MIHRYQKKGLNFVLDVNSGAVHLLDDISYAVSGLLDENMGDTCPQSIIDALPDYTADEIREAYDELYELLRHEREHGKIVWVMGPAFAFDHDARNAFSLLVAGGYVHALLAGNALATHDLEAAYLKTTLGQNIYTQQSQPNGHYNHLDTINAINTYGSIPAFIEQNGIRDGIMHACVAHGVPYVLAGSIRDDGPLPGVYGDVYAAQNAMRELVQQATTVICVATQLHTISTGNMPPSYCVRGGRVRPVYLYCVDVSEFVTNKLRDRGSLSSVPIVANAQDFLCRVAAGLGLPVAEKYDKINR